VGRRLALADARLGWWTGVVTAERLHRTFCVCLLATDQLSIDDRRCRRAPSRS